MPRLTDPIRLAAYCDALGNWAVRGFIQFELTVEARRWFTDQFANVFLSEVGRWMYDHVAAGGEIDEVKETRPEWLDHEFHHDLRLTIDNKSIYIETRLNYREPFAADESWIQVVNVHAR